VHPQHPQRQRAPESVREAAAMINAAKRPVLYLGGGVINAPQEIREPKTISKSASCRMKLVLRAPCIPSIPSDSGCAFGPESVREAAAMINAAKRPVLYLGGGGINAPQEIRSCQSPGHQNARLKQSVNPLPAE
jgi:thiamine pyrophosphate-dependent acetolactate synthase large subunit-like protein